MITEKTTLILGAGASVPYGFPSGRDLSELIGRSRKEDAWFYKIAAEIGFSRDEVDEFRRTFAGSQRYSIDDFLAKQPKYGAIGKTAIAFFIGSCERPERFFENPEDHWYQYLWNQIGDSWEEFERNTLRVVTFNYDRSLERYLVDCLKNTFGKSENPCREKLASIPIIHVYGHLGRLWPEDALPGRAYNWFMEADTLKIAAEGVHIIEDRRDEDPILDEINGLIVDADRVCFLGFSFDQSNLRRLRLDECIRKHQESGRVVTVYGTTWGLEEAETHRAIVQCYGSGSTFRPLKSEKLLRTCGVLFV